MSSFDRDYLQTADPHLAAYADDLEHLFSQLSHEDLMGFVFAGQSISGSLGGWLMNAAMHEYTRRQEQTHVPEEEDCHSPDPDELPPLPSVCSMPRAELNRTLHAFGFYSSRMRDADLTAAHRIFERILDRLIVEHQDREEVRNAQDR